MNSDVRVGGLVVLFEEPLDQKTMLPSHYILDVISFEKDLMAIQDCELYMFEEHTINGLYVATFKDVTITEEELIKRCKLIFTKYLTPNKIIT